MKILYCSDPLNDKVVDMEYEHEFERARKLGMDVHLISLEALLEGDLTYSVKRVPFFDAPEIFIYRGWMLKPFDYERLYDALQMKNAILINSPSAYRNGHYFPYFYKAIQNTTPYSVWVDINELENGFDVLFEKIRTFGSRPVIIKDYVKSRKHEWEEACFIPDASDKQRVQYVVQNFMDRQGSELNGGIVIREFIQLEQITKHPKSGMPLSNEYRLFFLHHQLIECTEYWDEAAYQDEAPDLEFFKEIARDIPSHFFTMDVAKMANGDWTIIEIGDGQVSGLPSHANVEKFYQSIMKV
ncbi:ATP-grasp domain-containing protein [Gorillibacterium sp. sgz5001074]|uniref:ATP-grasp domain-containing protein n=1 Tax=Gorillibacterium sp. sgz5001074 TaxID=3446695 RepID=UPI003F66B444